MNGTVCCVGTVLQYCVKVNSSLDLFGRRKGGWGTLYLYSKK